MSDDEYDSYDDDDYFWIDDGPVAEADELAAQAIQSPVYEVPLEVVEGYSDWEEYPDWDEYYDGPSGTQGQKAVGGEALGSGMKRKAAGQTSKARKRRKLVSTEEIPELSLGEAIEEFGELCSPTSIVVWKTEATFMPRQLPVICDGQGEEVALLKDWRKRFKPPYKYPVATAKVNGDKNSNKALQDSDAATGKESTLIKSKLANDSVRSRKRPAESSESAALHPPKRTLTSLATAPAETHTSSKAPAIPTRKRKAQDPPEPVEAAQPTPRNPAPDTNPPPRNPVSANPSAPLYKSASRTRKAHALAERKESNAPVTAADGAGTARRRSKRLKDA